MSRKRMVRIPADSAAQQWTGPVMVRGWLRVREPWRHPLAALVLFRKWLHLRRDVERAPGFLSLEYWQRIESLLFGMHVAWSSRELLDAVDRFESHRDIARWATGSTLVIAMKLETFAKTSDERIVHLGGFYICTDESDVPEDALFPSNRVGSGVG
jgi:hypothetical protein